MQKFGPIIIAALISVLPFSSVCYSKEYFCNMTYVKSGQCKKGDIIYAGGGPGVLLFCDFDEPMIAKADGVFCRYLGYERGDRKNQDHNNPFDIFDIFDTK